MKTPISYRNEIPFYTEKTEADYRKDIYERYDEMVVRQSALHLADGLWGKYPMQTVLDFAKDHYSLEKVAHILEIGCGVGRWIGTLAQTYPQATCWGIDYSYQMLKRAQEFWIQGKEVLIDLSDKGFPEKLKVRGKQLDNLRLGLAKAASLPFADNSQDLVVNSFLLDRLPEPDKGLVEMHRVLKPNGKLILITPLNFNQLKHWETLYPPTKLNHLFHQIGFDILQEQKEMIIEEPLDRQGNMVVWKCIGWVANKIEP